jgi:hypothetical protein
MGKELVQFYTNPHTGQLYLYPIEYTFLNVYSFPIAFVFEINSDLLTRLVYLGYEQHNAVLTGNFIWFNKLKEQIDNILNSVIASNSNKFSDLGIEFLKSSIESRRALTYETIQNFNKNFKSSFLNFMHDLAIKDKYFVFATSTLKNDACNSNFLQLFPIVEYKDSFIFNPIYSAQHEKGSDLFKNYIVEYVFQINLMKKFYTAYNTLTDGAKIFPQILDANLKLQLKTQILNSMNTANITREIQYFVDYMVENFHEIVLNKDMFSEYFHQMFNNSTQIISKNYTKKLLNIDQRLKISAKSESKIDISKLIQSGVDTQRRSCLSNILEFRAIYDKIFYLLKLNRGGSANKTSEITSLFSARNHEVSLSLILKNMFDGIMKFNETVFNCGQIFEKIETEFQFSDIINSETINNAVIFNSTEKFTKDLVKSQQLKFLITATLNFRQLIFNAYFFNSESNPKDLKILNNNNIMEKQNLTEINIIHDTLYFEAIARVTQIMSPNILGNRMNISGVINAKYYGLKRTFKSGIKPFRNIRMSKAPKNSEKILESILNFIHKERDVISSRMEYGCKFSNTTEELKICLAEKSIQVKFIDTKTMLTDKQSKRSILDDMKNFMSDKLNISTNIDISLETVKTDTHGYTPFITLKFDSGEKFYLDFGYPIMGSDSAERLIAKYNDIVGVHKDYHRCYETIIIQLEKFEKMMLIPDLTQEAIKLELSELTEDPKLLDKLKDAIINIREQIADKLKSGVNLTKYEVDKLLKSSLNIDKFVLNELYHRWYFLPSDGPYDEMILPQDYPYSTKPVNGINQHPFPNGADKANREIPVDINILTNVIDFCGNLWEANIFLYGGYTPQQALKHFVNCIFDWLDKYAPTKIDKIPEYYPDSYTIYDNTDLEREDYWRLYKWIRWYSEALILNVPKADEVQLLGNVYIKRLLEDLIKYFEDHHGVYGVPGTKVIDKIKGLRHKWLDKYHNMN